MDLNIFFQELDLIFKKKDIKQAETFILEWMEKAQKQGDIAGILAIANELGGIYRVTSRFEEGKNAYNIALQSIKLLGLENTEQHGTTLLNLASVYAASKNNVEALNLYEQAAEIFEQAGLSNDYRLAALYNNISHVYDELNQLDKAEANAEKSLRIIEGFKDFPIERATTYTSLGCIYIKLKRYAEAERNLFTAEQIFKGEQGKLDPHYAATLSAMGELYYYMDNYILSIQYFEQALELVKINYGENMYYASICNNIAQVYDKIDNPSKKNEYEVIARNIEERIRKI